jgi:HD-GYP domain-containing protein (c-di-GMP phosphodiesterase class II)/CHASE3 domain sensor protein
MRFRGRTFGLTARLLVAGAFALAVVVLVFALLGSAVLELRKDTNERRDAQHLAIASDHLQQTVLDLESAERAFLITDQKRFLDQWRAARRRLPGEERELRAQVTTTNSGGRALALALVDRIVARVDSYVNGHGASLVRRARAPQLALHHLRADVIDGKRQLDELRTLFARLNGLATSRTNSEDADAKRAVTRALVVGVAGLLVVLLVLAGGLLYIARTVARPVMRVAEAASAVADGTFDHATRLSEGNGRAAPEVSRLTESFDSMAEMIRVQRERVRGENAFLERRVSERTADLEKARYEALLMLAVAAEYRDDDTHRHTQRVGRNAALVAEQLGLGQGTVDVLRLAAPLHDVGKIGIADSILLKDGPLTAAEFERMKQHVVIGASILGASSEPLFYIAAEIARTHHEHWDGSGYCDGLSGEQIPLAGRIVAVVDVFDALTHERPYKDPWPIDRALDELRARSGSHFDPDVVAAFEALDPQLLHGDVSSIPALT